MSIQTTYSAAPATAFAGMEDGTSPFREAISTVVSESAGIAPGLCVFRGTEGDFTARKPPAVAADSDSISGTPIATSASQQVLDTELAGVIGTGLISPARKIIIVRSSHANQDAVTAVLLGFNYRGELVSENIAFADGGGDTLTSVNYYSRVVSLTIPPQGGTGGTTEIGHGVAFAIGPSDVMGVSLHTHKALVNPATANNEVYEDEDTMPVLRRGRIWVSCETAWTAGNRPLVRAIAAGAEVLGAFRGTTTDSGDAAVWEDAKFLNSGSAAGLALLEVFCR
jgi:hypothetical protein